MTRTPTLPITDRGMWRRLLSRADPDAGGDHEFIWTGAVRDLVCDSRVPPWGVNSTEARSDEQPARVPFDSYADFAVQTDRAVSMASAVAEPFAYLLRQVADCYPASEGPLYDQQRLGASYKSLAAIGHAVGMAKGERRLWYRLSESIPLSQRHAGHLLSRLKRRAA